MAAVVRIVSRCGLRIERYQKNQPKKMNSFGLLKNVSKQFYHKELHKKPF